MLGDNLRGSIRAPWFVIRHTLPRLVKTGMRFEALSKILEPLQNME